MAVAKATIDTRRWGEAVASGGQDLIVSYDPARDFFALTLGEPGQTYSHDEGDLSIQVDMETNEATGLYIYDFERSYLRRHPEVTDWWREVKAEMGRRARTKPVPRATAIRMPAPVAQLLRPSVLAS